VLWSGQGLLACRQWCLLLTHFAWVLTAPAASAAAFAQSQERWLDNRDCGYVPSSSSGGEVAEGERRVKRFAPFSDGIKACLGQVRVLSGVVCEACLHARCLGFSAHACVSAAVGCPACIQACNMPITTSVLCMAALEFVTRAAALDTNHKPAFLCALCVCLSAVTGAGPDGGAHCAGHTAGPLLF
jgi:hypothetical protein